MKISKLAFAIIALGLSISTVNVQAQTNSHQKWEGFVDKNQFNSNFENKTAELIKTESFVSVAQAAKDLVALEGKKIQIPLAKQRKKTMDDAAIAKTLEPSFVAYGTAYDCGNCHRAHVNTASGYVISEEGHIVTNYHVIEGYIESTKGTNLAMTIQMHDGEVYLVKEILSTFKDADLAIVKIDTKGKKLVALPLGNTAEVGANIFVLSNPAPMVNYFSTGKVARNYISPVSKTASLPQTDITADYAAGSSGAPIVDQYGNLVSTVSSTRSIYYNMADQKDLQMVVKTTKPVVLLKELIINL